LKRKEKEIKDQSVIEDIFESNKICRIGFVDKNVPYVISMNYGYAKSAIYLHTATSGKKLNIIETNNNVCVEITDSVEIIESNIPCKFGTRYRSLICNGKINILTDLEEKKEALKVLMNQHTQRSGWNIPDTAIEQITLLKIELETISGKISGA